MSSVAFATDKNAGTSAAQFLKIGAGARPSGMGEAFVAVADDVNAVHYNAAGLTQLEQMQLSAMHLQWFEGLSYDFGAFVIPAAHGSWGISAATLKSDDIEKRDADEGTQGTFETMDAAYALSYAHKLNDQLSLGITGRFIQEKIDSTSAEAWGTDLGVHYKMQNYPLMLGFAAKNIGTEIKFNSESDPQPMTFDFGAAHKSFRNRLLIGVDLRKPNDNGLKLGGGAEWKQPLNENLRFALRTGFNSAQTDADATGISFGAGIGFKQFDIDFAWVPLGDLGNTFRYSALLRF